MIRRLLFVWLAACGSKPLLKVPKVLGWAGDTRAVSVAGPMALACDGVCQGSLADSVVRGADASIAVTFTVSGSQWVGVPKVRLAYGTHYTLALPTAVQAPALAFTTEPDPTSTPKVTMWPVDTAPANLSWVVLSFSPPVARGGVLDMYLQDGDTEVWPAWIDAPEGWVDSAILWGPFSDPRCLDGETQQLCVGKTYTLTTPSGLRAPSGAPLQKAGTLTVAAAASEPLTWETLGVVTANDAGVRMARGTSRQCLLSAAVPLNGNSGPRWPLALASGAAVETHVTADSEYAWSVLCRDAAGNETPNWDFAFHTAPKVSVRLSEIVVDPLQDWNDSTGEAGVPYDAVPGPGSGGAPDAYVELYNSGTQAADVSAWHLAMGVSSDEVLGDLWHMSPVRACGAVPLASGARAVVRLTAPGVSAGSHAAIVLSDALGIVRDAVTLGVGDVPDGAAVDVATEAVSRCPDEGGPWLKTRATPGDANACG